MTLGWPRYEAATFSGWDSVPDEFRDSLLAAGLPSSLFGRRYTTLEEPVLVEDGFEGPLVRFGQTMLFGGIYWDPSSGQVREHLDRPGMPPLVVGIVNTTLEQFASTAKVVIELFPYYDNAAQLEDRMRAAAKISAAIEQIDDGALSPDTFWSTFVDDVVAGDFATDDVVGSNSR